MKSTQAAMDAAGEGRQDALYEMQEAKTRVLHAMVGADEGEEQMGR